MKSAGGVKEASVILVHGIWLNGLEWLPLARRLRNRDYAVRIFHYPSVRRTPAENAARLEEYVGRLHVPRVHLVAHSLGGILVMHLLARSPDLPPGRVVFIGTPAHGSAAARRLARLPGVRAIMGRSREDGVLGGAPAWSGRRELGVIAGDLPLGAGRVLGGLSAPNDGTVAVAETRIEQAADTCIIHGSHMGLLWLRETADRVDSFLSSGGFGPQKC